MEEIVKILLMDKWFMKQLTGPKPRTAAVEPGEDTPFLDLLLGYPINSDNTIQVLKDE